VYKFLKELKMNKQDSLWISEAFYSVQAEGVTSGVPAFFVRLKGCNLCCGGPKGSLMKSGKASWWCDTEAVWRQGKEISYQELVQMFVDEGQLDNIIRGQTNIVWTGGEPTMAKNREGIKGFIDWFEAAYPASTLFHELETNGTIWCDDDFYHDMNQVNCSPKLANCGMAEKIRINEDAIRQIIKHPNGWFKFVISTEEDVLEFQREYINRFSIDPRKVVIMPGVDNREDLAERTRFLYEMAKKYGYRAITRGHILAWDKTTGV